MNGKDCIVNYRSFTAPQNNSINIPRASIIIPAVFDSKDKEIASLHTPKNDFSFQIYLTTPRSVFNDNTPYKFAIKLITKIYGIADLIVLIHIIHPSGPLYDRRLTLIGQIDGNHRLLVSDDQISLTDLRNNGFITDNSFKLEIDISSPETVILSGSCDIESALSSSSPTLRSITCKLLSPHAFDSNFILTSQEVFAICSAARQVILHQPPLLLLKAPIIIVGALHGHYSDLLQIFQKYGPPTYTAYLFLGDYIDHGRDGVDILSLLLCFKILYPENIFLLRGNHEFYETCSRHGFLTECSFKHLDIEPFLAVFEVLPLAAIVGSIFCCHAGLSPALSPSEWIPAIEAYERPAPFVSEALHDLVWSDPEPNSSRSFGYGPSIRDISCSFGYNALHNFLNASGLKMMVRTHTRVDGFNFPFGEDGGIVTIFSSSWYFDPKKSEEKPNKAAVMILDSSMAFKFWTFGPTTPERIEEIQRTDFTHLISSIKRINRNSSMGLDSTIDYKTVSMNIAATTDSLPTVEVEDDKYQGKELTMPDETSKIPVTQFLFLEGRDFPELNTSCEIMFDGKKLRGKIENETHNPKWNDVFEFQIPPDKLRNVVTIVVNYWSKTSKVQTLGKIEKQFTDFEEDSWIPIQYDNEEVLKILPSNKPAEIHIKVIQKH